MDRPDDLLLARLSQLEARLESLGNAASALDHRRCIYLGHDRLLVETHTGLRLYLDTRDIVLTPILALKGDWEPEVTHALRTVLRPGMTFIDVGANIGYFTLIAAQILHGNGQIHAFEADPEMHQLLVDNVNLNWFFDGVHMRQQAVFSEETQLRFYKRLKYQANSSIAQLSDEELSAINDASQSFDVEATRLDHYAEKHAVTRVDVVKIDVEGAEPRIFQGMKRIIEDNPQLQIICEWSPSQLYQAGSSPTEFLGILRDYGLYMRTVEAPDLLLEPERLLEMSHNNLLLSR
jgi:FkbM family methyltransferase